MATAHITSLDYDWNWMIHKELSLSLGTASPENCGQELRKLSGPGHTVISAESASFLRARPWCMFTWGIEIDHIQPMKCLLAKKQYRPDKCPGVKDEYQFKNDSLDSAIHDPNTISDCDRSRCQYFGWPVRIPKRGVWNVRHTRSWYYNKHKIVPRNSVWVVAIGIEW